MSICALEKDRILFDYIVNYVFPQYALSWNNFYTDIDSIPYNIRNEEKNTKARVARSPLVVTAKPELVISNDLFPVWRDTTLANASTGYVTDTNATKLFLGKIISDGCGGFDYQYIYQGRFDGANLLFALDPSWIILHLNLTQKSKGTSSTAVITVQNNTPPPSAYSTLNGQIIINDTRIITIKNALPFGSVASDINVVSGAINSGLSNTLYGLYGNRIFIAIKADQLSAAGDKASLSYNITFRVAETSGVNLPIAIAGVGPFVPV